MKFYHVCIHTLHRVSHCARIPSHEGFCTCWKEDKVMITEDITINSVKCNHYF